MMLKCPVCETNNPLPVKDDACQQCRTDLAPLVRINQIQATTVVRRERRRAWIIGAIGLAAVFAVSVAMLFINHDQKLRSQMVILETKLNGYEGQKDIYRNLMWHSADISELKSQMMILSLEVQDINNYVKQKEAHEQIEVYKDTIVVKERDFIESVVGNRGYIYRRNFKDK
ncbi:MAG: hypothetical protein KAR31_10575 [Candidatus Omnitrophica bacterium]|nr:hypothetical protein [Candidatus Omnitrophota bacterium]